MHKELEGKVEFYRDWTGNAMYVDKGFASLLFAAFADNEEELYEIVSDIRYGFTGTTANKIAYSTGLDEGKVLEYLNKSGIMRIYLERNDKLYRMVICGAVSDTDLSSTIFQPIGDHKKLRSDARETMQNELSYKMGDVYRSQYNLGYNVYKCAAVLVSNTDYNYLNAVINGQEVPEEQPAPEKQEEAPVIQVQQQVVERVIEKEKPAVLEGLLQEAVTGLIAKVAVDDMVPRIKEKIIDEFGIEPIKHVVVDVTGEERDVPGIVHKAFDAVCHYVKNDVPIMLYGPSGTGKGYLCEQVAEALGLDYYFMNSVTEEYKINGFTDVNGNYHESEFYKAFTNGGLFFLDEIDASAPEVLVCLNAAIANRYFTFPNGFVKAHENFRVVAAGNTLGTGADASYTGRMQLDAASLNRFVVVPVDYDIKIDRLSAQNDEELVEFAIAYRDAAKKCGLATICSYRNISQIKISEPAMTLEEALLYCLTKEMNKDDINIMYSNMEYKLDSSNRYLKAFKNIVPMV